MGTGVHPIHRATLCAAYSVGERRASLNSVFKYLTLTSFVSSLYLIFRSQTIFLSRDTSFQGMVCFIRRSIRL